MALNFKLRLLLLLVKLQRKVDFSKTTPDDFRKYTREKNIRLTKVFHYPPEKLFKVWDVFIDVSKNDKIQIRIYKPSDLDNQPILMYFHGGGFVIGDIEGYELNCRRLAKQNNAVVVSVRYRLAPEHPFPTPSEDCYAATLWAVENFRLLGANPSQVIVMGDSAGGNLATVVTMMAREKGQPKISCQILIYPTVDATLSMGSINKLGKSYLLTKELMVWFVNHYCGNESDLRQSYLSPLFAKNLKNLPVALIATCEFDPLKDEGECYAKNLIEAGNQVIFEEYKGMIHTFFQMPKYLKAARVLESQITYTLNQVFGATNQSTIAS
jgi:acetyl esterase/lipase